MVVLEGVAVSYERGTPVPPALDFLLLCYSRYEGTQALS